MSDYSINLLNNIHQVNKTYELYDSIIKKDKYSSYKNSIRLSINPDNNPFINPSILKSFNIDYVKDNLIDKEDYETAMSLMQTGDLLSNPETAFFIYNSKSTTNANNSVSINTTPFSKGSFNLEVLQSAKQQIYHSDSFIKTDITNLDAGKYMINIESNNKNSFVEINVESGDTHYDILKKLSSKINLSDLNVKSKVETDKSDSSKAYLSISSNETGTDNAFLLSDVVGGLQEIYLSNSETNIVQESQNSIIKINGKTIENQSNQIVIDDYNISININSELQNQYISVTDNTDKVSDIISSYAENISSFIEDLKEDNSAHSKLFLDRLFSDLDSVKGKLNEIGITIDSDKQTIEIDKQKIRDNIKNNPGFLQNTVSGNSGLSNIMNNNLSEYLKVPVDLFTIPKDNYESYSMIPLSYNIYNPYDYRNELIRL